MSFSADIRNFAKKTNSTLDEASRAIKISLFSSVIVSTRVDTGRARSNWQTTTGSPNYNITERLDPSGNSIKEEVRATVQGDTVDYLTNNLPYIEKLEEMDSMIGKNMARIERTIKESVKNVV